VPTRDFFQGVNPGWVTLEGDVDTRLQAALRSRSAKFKLEIRVNRTQTTDTFFDNLRFGGDAAPITNCYDGTGGAVNGPSEISLAGTTSSITDLLSFESTSNWTGDPTASVVTSADPTLGTNSLSVTQASGSKLTFTSTQFASSALAAAFPVGLTQNLTLDVKTPALATNQTLSGSIRLVLACPSANVWWSDAVSFESLPENQWTRARFNFPRALKSNLDTTGINCALRLESELSGQASGVAILYDNLRFESETPCTSYTVSSSAPFLTNMPGPPNGTAKRPYPICNAAQLTTIRNSAVLRDSHFILMQDIDLAGWNNMISAPGAYFRGTFDGQGRTIRNHTFQIAGAYVGLFGWIEGNGAVDGTLDGMVRNLRIENSDLRGAYAIGALAGRATSARIHNVIATNVRAKGTADSIGGLVGWATSGTRVVDSAALGVRIETATYYIGGLLGSIDGTVKNCRSEGAVFSTYGYAGGFVGVLAGGEISGSTSSANVSASTGSLVGGLIGISVGNVTNSSATGSVTGDGALGGLIGRATNGQITDCKARGTVSGSTYKTDWGAGGLIGHAANLIIARSSATGSVTSPNGTSIGGFIGIFNSSSITDSYSTGDVFAYSSGGGFIGSTLVSATVTRSYSTGNVRFIAATYRSAAFVGWQSGIATYTTSAVLSASNPSLPIVGNVTNSSGVSRFATSLFQSSTAFSELDWNFTDVWIIAPMGPSFVDERLLKAKSNALVGYVPIEYERSRNTPHARSLRSTLPAGLPSPLF